MRLIFEVTGRTRTFFGFSEVTLFWSLEVILSEITMRKVHGGLLAPHRISGTKYPSGEASLKKGMQRSNKLKKCFYPSALPD